MKFMQANKVYKLLLRPVFCGMLTLQAHGAASTAAKAMAVGINDWMHRTTAPVAAPTTVPPMLAARTNIGTIAYAAPLGDFKRTLGVPSFKKPEPAEDLEIFGVLRPYHVASGFAYYDIKFLLEKNPLAILVRNEKGKTPLEEVTDNIKDCTSSLKELYNFQKLGFDETEFLKDLKHSEEKIKELRRIQKLLESYKIAVDTKERFKLGLVFYTDFPSSSYLR